jgi:ligand-binding sensor protein
MKGDVAMELVDLCPLETWAELEREIYERSKLNPAVYNPEGIRINSNPIWPNRLCPEIKAIPKGQSFICATAHMNIAIEARQTRRPVIEACDAGMIKLVVPIFYKDTFLGAAGGCGLLMEEEAVDAFLVNKITDLEEDEIERLSEGIPMISAHQAQELVSFIQQWIERVVSDYNARR